MTESEITTELALVNTAIAHILQVGTRYEVESGASRRVFEATDLNKLRDLRTELQLNLDGLNEISGLVIGF